MSEWTTETADRIEAVVSTVRDRAVVPAQNATKAVVYGVLVGFFALSALVLLAVASFRMLESYLPGEVWLAHLVMGGIFVAGGVFCWARRGPRGP